MPSPKVATYDLKPEMSAYEVTERLVAAIEGGKYDLIVVNFANTDMVGHSGDLAAAIKAVEAVDRCLGRVREALGKAGGAMVVTADHGNAEMMRGSKHARAAHRPYAQPRAGRAGQRPWRGRSPSATAGWPTSRPRSWRLWDCRSRRR